MFDVKKMGKRIKELRGKASQDECAENLGISRGALSFYEQGKRTPDAEIIYRMCEYFNVSSDYLLGLTDNKTANTDLQAVCAFTGLNEDAIENIINRTSMPEPIYDKQTKTTYSATIFTPQYYEDNKKVINKILSCSWFWEIVFQYVVMEDIQQKSFVLQEKYNKARKNFSEGASSDVVYNAAEKVIQNYSDIDVARYAITRLIEKVSDIFDCRGDNTSQNKKNTEVDESQLPF